MPDMKLRDWNFLHCNPYNPVSVSCINFLSCYNIITYMRKQNYQFTLFSSRPELRERERVKSLNGFDLKFYNPNNQDAVFNGVFLFFKKSLSPNNKGGR